jgi:hypothetical protein
MSAIGMAIVARVIVGATAIDDRISSLTSLGGCPLLGHQKARFTGWQVQRFADIVAGQVDPIKSFRELFRQTNFHDVLINSNGYAGSKRVKALVPLAAHPYSAPQYAAPARLG